MNFHLFICEFQFLNSVLDFYLISIKQYIPQSHADFQGVHTLTVTMRLRIFQLPSINKSYYNVKFFNFKVLFQSSTSWITKNNKYRYPDTLGIALKHTRNNILVFLKTLVLAYLYKFILTYLHNCILVYIYNVYLSTCILLYLNLHTCILGNSHIFILGNSHIFILGNSHICKLPYLHTPILAQLHSFILAYLHTLIL